MECSEEKVNCLHGRFQRAAVYQTLSTRLQVFVWSAMEEALEELIKVVSHFVK